MTESSDRIGVIAGSGHLPLHVAKCLLDVDRSIYVAGLQGAADPALEKWEWEIGWYDIFVLKDLLDGLKGAGVTKIVLAGKVEHSEIYRTSEFDSPLSNFLNQLKDHRPSTILGGLIDLLTHNGFTVLPLTDVAPDLLPTSGLLAGPDISREQFPDLQLGWRIARIIADQDIGQTVIVKDGAVVAVEAMEGTDKAILRAGELSGGGMTVVKRAAADHDFRYDIPTIGPDTIQALDSAGGGCVVIEAGRSFMLDFDRISALCDETGITLLSGRETANGGVHWPQT